MITTRKELVDTVIADYQRWDTELNGLFFDFPVEMKKGDIIEAYAECQRSINGDEVVRMENGEIQENLIPGTDEFSTVYNGNCMEYLESLNGDDRFRRFCEDEEVDFVF